MSYDSERQKTSRHPINVVEIDLDYCSLTFGNAPCTATGTSDEKCRNTYSTCRDKANFSNAPITYQFCEIREAIPPEINSIPCVTRITFAPTYRQPSEGLGARGRATITIKDFSWHDRNVDKYASERSWNYETQGTFWGRLIASNPYYVGRPLRIRPGFITGLPDRPTWDFANFDTRHYLIESIDGPDSNGIVTLKAKDPLTLMDSGSFEYPTPTTTTVNGVITEVQTTIPVIGVAQISNNSFVAINDEVIFVTTANQVTNALEGCTRSINFVLAVHTTGDGVQQCANYADQNPVDIIYDLIINQRGLPTTYIDGAEWSAIRDQWFSGFLMVRIITEPTSINDLIAEISQQAGLDIWWDEKVQKIKIKALGPALSGTKVLNDESNLIQDSIKIQKLPKDRISQILYYYDKLDPMEPDEPRHYAKLSVFSAGQNALEYNEPRIHTIFGSWITEVGIPIVNTVGGRLLNRNRNDPLHIKFTLDLKDTDIWTGSDFIFDSRTLQSFNGANLRTSFEVIKASETRNMVEYEAMFTGLGGERNFIVADNLAITYDTATPAQREQYGFISDNTGLMSDQTSGYQIL